MAAEILPGQIWRNFAGLYARVDRIEDGVVFYTNERDTDGTQDEGDLSLDGFRHLHVELMPATSMPRAGL